MDLFERLLALLLVGLLLAATLWMFRKKGGMALKIGRQGRAKGPLESLSRLQLSPQHSVHLVRAGDRRLLVGLCSGNLVVLDRFGPEVSERLGGEQGVA